MRYANRRNRRRKRRSCFGGLFRFILLIGFVLLIGYFVKTAYTDSDIAGKIRRTQYPIKYEYFVEKYAEEYSLDKYLVYSVIRTESRFDKYAVSSIGAKGLMQVTDETGRDCAQKLGVADFEPDKLFDPETNIRFGCYYLSYLIKHYDGRRDVAVAAYNAGIGNVEDWLKNPEYSNSNGELINIPFRETKNYVSRVREAYDKYTELYERKEEQK